MINALYFISQFSGASTTTSHIIIGLLLLFDFIFLFLNLGDFFSTLIERLVNLTINQSW